MSINLREMLNRKFAQIAWMTLSKVLNFFFLLQLFEAFANLIE